MQALCNSHMIVHEMSPRQFFRAAYYWKHDKDIPDLSLANDAKKFDEWGEVPAYVTDYLVHCYGVT